MTSIQQFYEEFKAGNRAFQEAMAQKMLAAKRITADGDAGAPSTQGVVYVRMSGEFRILGLQIQPAAWDSGELTEELLAAEVTSAYNLARKAVHHKYQRVVLDNFGIS